MSAVCGGGEWSYARREARITATRHQLELTAAHDLLARLGARPSCDGTLDAMLRDNEIRAEQVALVHRLAAQNAVVHEIERLKANAVAASAERVTGELRRAQVRESIEGASVLFSTQDMPNDISEDETLLGDFVAAYERFCGTDGWQQGSFTFRGRAREGKLPKLYVVVCPGWIAAAPPRPEAAARNLAMVVSHELGHVIDVALQHDRQPLGDYLDCVAAAFGAPRPGPGGLSADDRKELAADFWAQRSIERELESQADRAHRLELLRAAWSGLCHRPLERDHPSGDYRIRAVLGTSAVARRALGCPAPRASCVPKP